MFFPFWSHQLVHWVPNLADTSRIKEIAHIYAEAVDKLAFEIRIFHLTAEHTCGIPCDREGCVLVYVRVVRIIPMVDNPMIVTT